MTTPGAAREHVATLRLALPSVLVLLPPSETKHPGGDGVPMDLNALSTPQLTPLREQLVTAVVALAGDVPASRAALGLSPAQDDEIARNAALRASPSASECTAVMVVAIVRSRGRSV